VRRRPGIAPVHALNPDALVALDLGAMPDSSRLGIICNFDCTSEEVIFARPAEINERDKLWAAPAEHMKLKKRPRGAAL
jgi:hypothetical protein